MKIEDNIQICLFYEGGVPKQSNFFSKKVDNKKLDTTFIIRKWLPVFIYSLQLEKEKIMNSKNWLHGLK